MSRSTHHISHSYEILGQDAEWSLRDEFIAEDLVQNCKVNAAIDLKRDAADVSFCVLVSAGCSHIAAVEAVASLKEIKVTVYHLNNGYEQKWSVDYNGPDQEFQGSSSSSRLHKSQMHGGITEDGESVLLIYRSAEGPVGAYVVNANDFTWRNPPSDTGSPLSIFAGQLSDDSECLFYTRSGTAFGRGGQAKVVEIYSIRHLARIKAFTFGFGDGRKIRNTWLLSHLRVKGPIYMAIDTISFDSGTDERHSPPVVASSDNKLDRNFAGINTIDPLHGVPRAAFISPDDAHMFYVEPVTAVLHHWDLNNPTLTPLGGVLLPGVARSQYSRWLLHGQETTLKDRIPAHIQQVRFSPECKVVTVVIVDEYSIVINILLTFNLQLIYHHVVADPTWPPFLPEHIGFNESTGLNIFAMFPIRVRTDQGLPRLFGVSSVLISLPEIFLKIKAIEDYFDSAGDRLITLKREVERREARLECQFSWKPGVIERNDRETIILECGSSTRTASVDARRQSRLYDVVYTDSISSVRMRPAPEIRQFLVPHLFSFVYPWASENSVSVFGVIMKHEYHVVAIGPAASTCDPRSEVIRALYTSDIVTSPAYKEYLEIYKSGPNYFLRVYKMGDGDGWYSGAPMPVPIWTPMSPHFLQEDAWYDTFVINRAAHVITPDSLISTPNLALTSTANYCAYFEPRTWSFQKDIDYGHRSRSAYVVPKYLLWRECGLRGLRKPNPDDARFSNAPFPNSVGPFLRSIYDDKTYDETKPLFPTAFAMACNANHRSQTTEEVDAFFRRLHREGETLLKNCHAVSYTLPVMSGSINCIAFLYATSRIISVQD